MPSDLTSAIAATHPNPSPAQRAAGNYRKGKINFHGLTITIETPKGKKRRPEWKPLAAHYGYVNRTEGKDGDHIDVFVGPKLDSEIVFVVDQVTPGGRFNEHKCVLGCTSKQRARQLYLANYQSGWKCGPITAMTIEQFKMWLEKGDTTKRVAEQVSRYDKSQGLPGAAAAPAAPASPTPSPSGASFDVQSTHRVGEIKSFNGKSYRLNENHRWELANPEEVQAGSVSPGADSQQQPPGQQPAAPSPPPSPANDQAARNKFSQSRISSVHPEIGGLMHAIHQSPHFQKTGEYASFDVHQRVAGSLYSTLAAHAGKEMGGGNVVDLGQGRVGFASEAGSIVVWPADEQGRHQISYTNKTGIVGRAMAKGQGGDDGEQEADGMQAGDGDNEPPIEAEAVDDNPGADEETPPLPAQRQQPSGSGSGKLPDEEIYDAQLVTPKERPAHVQLRQRANASKEKFLAAHAKYEQAVDDHERPDRIRNLKRHAGELRSIAVEHDRQAKQAEGEHKSRLKESGKSTKARMKELGIGPYAGRGGKSTNGEKSTGKSTTLPAPSKGKESKDKETPLIDHAEKNPGKGDVPTPTPEALEMGKLPKPAQLAGAASQTYLKHGGLSVTPENHKAIQHAIRRGWIKDKKELRGVIRRAKAIHEKGSAKNPDGSAASDHAALREAIRRKGNRERRISWAATVKQKAGDWDMTPQEFHDTASEVYRAYTEHHDEREAAKEHARKNSGLTAKDINKLENDGFDYGSDHPKVKGLDSLGQEMAEMFPGLGWDKDHDAKVWELLREGTAKKKPSKTSPEFMSHLEEFLSHNLQAGGGGFSPEEIREMEEQNAETSFGDEAIPFAKLRAGIVQRYRKWRVGRVNYPHGI